MSKGAQWLISSKLLFGGDHWVGYTLAALVHCVLLVNVVAVGAVLFIWMERKVSGRIQDRLGPTRVGGKFGWLQTLADGLKLITKEDLMPRCADAMLFKLAPYVSFASSFAAYLALPFASDWVGQNINVAVFFIVAVMGLEVFGVILAGYASGSKWSLFVAMREAAQVVSGLDPARVVPTDRLNHYPVTRLGASDDVHYIARVHAIHIEVHCPWPPAADGLLEDLAA